MRTRVVLSSAALLAVGVVPLVTVAAPNVAAAATPPAMTVTAAAPLPAPAVGVEMTLLADGRVLLSGDGRGHASSQTIFDPATDTYTPTGSMPCTFGMGQGYAPVLLPSGKVFAACGSTTEIFNPSTNAWSVGPGLTNDRGRPIVMPIGNGRVMVAGGITPAGQVLASTDVYDSATGGVSPGPSMATPRWVPGWAPLPDGRLLVIGGDGTDGGAINDAEIYDPANGRFTTTAPMRLPTTSALGVGLANGEVLVFGGVGSGTSGQDAEVYDPATSSWRFTSPTPTSNLNTAAVVALHGGSQVVVAGGSGQLTGTTQFAGKQTSVYNVATDTWTRGPDLAASAYYVGGVALDDNTAFFAGGYSNVTNADVDNTYRVSLPPNTDDDLSLKLQGQDASAIGGQVTNLTLTVTANGPADGTNVTLAGPVSNGFSFVSVSAPGVTCAALPCDLGTISAGTTISAAVQLRIAPTIGAGSLVGTALSVTGDQNDPAPNNNYSTGYRAVVTQSATPSPYAWVASQAQVPPFERGTGVALADGRVLIAGGVSYYDPAGTDSAWIYDPVTDQAAPVAPMPEPENEGTGILLADGRVMIAGGFGPNADGSQVQIYDPTSNSWSLTPPMTRTRETPVMTRLADGSVLAGGNGSGIDIWSPTAPYWQQQSTPYGFLPEAIAPLPNGQVLVASAMGGSQARMWIYNPATYAFHETTPLPENRVSETATPLPNGDVLVTGGVGFGDSDFNSLSSFVYDPTSATWTSEGVTGPHNTDQRAITLTDGRVLVVGGNWTNTDIFDPATGTWTPGPQLHGAYGAIPYWPVIAPLPHGGAIFSSRNFGTFLLGANPDFTPPDTTAPTVTGTPDRQPNENGWYNAPVTVSWHAVDSDSPVPDPAPTTLSSDGANQTTTSAQVCDPTGNCASGSYGPVDIDQTPPTVTINGVTGGAKYVVGTPLAPTCAASDSLSGLSVPCQVTVTGGNGHGVGQFTATATATDLAGNVTTTSVPYSVIYGWNGFDQPINDTGHHSGESTSVFKAGSTVPTLFTLRDANGQVVTPAIAPEWITPQQGSSMNQPVDETVYTTPGDSGNAYKPVSGQWQYNWKSPSSGAGHYWRIGVKLDDGQTYIVYIALR